MVSGGRVDTLNHPGLKTHFDQEIQWAMEWGKPHEMKAELGDGLELLVKKQGKHWVGWFFSEPKGVRVVEGYIYDASSWEDAQVAIEKIARKWIEKGGKG